jgi:putative transposase
MAEASVIACLVWMIVQLLITPSARFLVWPAAGKLIVRRSNAAIQSTTEARQRRKPEWIAQDILRLKALLPKSAGVRQIAAAFNRIQAGKAKAANTRAWRVSKSYVANLLRSRKLEVQRIRESIRQRQPGISAVNHIWGVDITGKKDMNGQLHHILGIIDHGSRKLIALFVTSKHSHLLLKHVLAAFFTHGKPRRIRTDNEYCFTSQIFQNSLKALGIRLQTSELHCPWQNGRIERLFGTFKQQLHQIQVDSAEQLQELLDEFKYWYNTIRLHQHLSYQTPQEVWQQQRQPQAQESNSRAQAKPTWWTGWDGQLSGVQWQC